MRVHGGRSYYTVGEVAEAVGVSRQTLRVWERKGLLATKRSPGGQRLYGEEDLQRAGQVASLRRRHGWNPAAIGSSASMEQPAHASAQLALGRRIRAARQARGLTLAELAGRVGVSSSSLASVERGESETSVRMLSRLADALGLTMAEFAPGSPSAPPVIRPPDRPRTVLEGGVTWEELVAPGHAVEPALLIVPPGGSSGGPMTRAGENFAYMLSGSLHFMLLDDDTDTTIREGDALALRPGSTWSWHNPGNVEARCLWVEQRADAPREEPGGAEGAARDGEDAPNGGADGRSSWSR